jgi:DNA-binding transcriptional ArsR family regulator
VTDPQPLFSALSDPTRRTVFERLTSKGPASASSLASEMPVSRQAIAKHLRLLDEAGLVEKTRFGREVRYTARVQPLKDVTSWLEDVGAAWDDRLRRLRESFD